MLVSLAAAVFLHITFLFVSANPSSLYHSSPLFSIIYIGAQVIGPFSPLAASSPSDSRTVRNMATGMMSTAMSPTTLHGKVPLSPTLSDVGSTMSLPDEMERYRNQPYVAPKKLQIVKPLEGSMTLLKWKLLASPQLGGATSYFSDATHPGVHLKKTKLTEKQTNLLAPDAKIKSLSVNDLSVLNTSYPSAGRRRPLQHREGGIHTKASQLTLSISSTDKGKGMNNISGLLPSTTEEEEDTSPSKKPRDHQGLSVSQGSAADASPQSSSSFLSQMGSLLGSGWSRFGLNRRKAQPQGTDHQDHEPISSAASTEVGLAGLL